MSKLAEKTKDWETLLKSSSRIATKNQCVSDIMATISTFRDIESRSAIACKVLHVICTEAGQVKQFEPYNELFTKLQPHISGGYWEKFIKFYKYYIGILVTKKYYNDFIAILPLLDQFKLETENAIQNYFEINTSFYAALLAFKVLPDDSFQSCADNVLLSLQTAQALNPELFITLLDDLLNMTKHHFRYLLMNNLNGTTKFLGDVTAALATLKTVNDIETFTIKSSTHLLFMFKIEMENKNMPTIALSYLKTCMGLAPIAEQKKPSQKMQKILYFLLKLFWIIDSNDFSTHLNDVLTNLEKLLELDKNTVPWVVNSAVTICEILNTLVVRANGKFTSENVQKTTELVIQLSKILPTADNLTKSFNKAVCLNCSNVARHEIFNLAYISINLFRRSIELKQPDNKVAHSFLTVLNYVTKSCFDLNCVHAESILYKLCNNCCKAIHSVNSAAHAPYALRALNILRSMKIKQEFIKDVHLTQLCQNILSLMGRRKMALEVNCLYVVHLLNIDEKPKDVIIAQIATCCLQYKDAGFAENLSICDILDKAELEFEVPKYDREKMIRWQFEASTQLAGSTVLQETLAKKVTTAAQTGIELAEIVCLLGKIEVSGLQTKVEAAIKNLKKDLIVSKEDVSKKLLALAQLQVRLVKFKLEKAKKNFAGLEISEASLKEIDCINYQKVNIIAENDILAMLIEARKYFEQYYSQVVKNETDQTNWEQLINDISFLARHFNIRGYIDHAYKAWLLIYQFSNYTELKLHRIRAISYFAEYSHIIEEFEDCIDLAKAITETAGDILKFYRDLDSHTPRQQNYVLLAIIHTALFYSRRKDYRRSHLLSELAKKKRAEMNARKNDSELISASLLAFNFHMITKCDESNIIISPYAYIRDILDNIRNIKHITSEDSVNIPAFLFRVLLEMSEFVINRLCALPIKPHLFWLLKFATENGMGLRIAQVVSLLATIDLQLEQIENCQTKLIILDEILTNEIEFTNKKEGAPVSSRSLCAKKETFDNIGPYSALQFIEPTRKVAIKSPRSPKHFKLLHAVSNANTTQYFVTHPSKCTCPFCTNPIFRMIAFQVGCVHAHRYYITGDYSSCESFFEKAFNWWWKPGLTPTVLEHLFHNSIFSMISIYLNVLRRLNLNDKAIQVLDVVNLFYEKHPKLVDIACQQNLAEQRMCIITNAPISQTPVNVRSDPMKPSTSRNVKNNSKTKTTRRFSPVVIIPPDVKDTVNAESLVEPPATIKETRSTRARRRVPLSENK